MASLDAGERGFTVVELLTGVVLVGVLLAVGFDTYRQQLIQSKSSEAISVLSRVKKAIIKRQTNRAASESLATPDVALAGVERNRDLASPQRLPTTRLCSSAEPVPGSLLAVRGKRHQSSPAEWRQGSETSGWLCLGFSLNGAQHYQYGYERAGAQVDARRPAERSRLAFPRDQTFVAWARGDLDGDGRTSWFSLNGAYDHGAFHFAARIETRDEGE